MVTITSYILCCIFTYIISYGISFFEILKIEDKYKSKENERKRFDEMILNNLFLESDRKSIDIEIYDLVHREKIIKILQNVPPVQYGGLFEIRIVNSRKPILDPQFNNIVKEI